jgi:hypothetical protein
VPENNRIKRTLLVSRIVENWFSIMRNSVQHPTLDEYLQTFYKKLIDFAREFSDLLFSPAFPDKDMIGPSYHRISGVRIHFASLEARLKEFVADTNRGIHRFIFWNPLLPFLALIVENPTKYEK